MAVGDPNQAIYGFRGASAAALADYVDTFGGPDVVVQSSLSVSWRNEAAVLAAANVTAAPLREGAQVSVAELRSRGEHLGVAEPRRAAAGVAAHMAVNLFEEAHNAAAWILERRAELGADATAAVLCRRKALFGPIVDALRDAGIPYEVVGLGGLLDTPVVADLLALLEVAHDPSRGDSLMRLLTSSRVNLGPRDLIALKHYLSTYEQTRSIYMDGRAHPGPNAPHTWMGFSTGHYEGDMLVVETTHLKQGWVRRNGLPMSDQAHMTEYFVRNGDLMTQVVVLVDPVFLAEPLVKSQDFVRSTRELAAQTWLWVCEPVIEVPRPDGEVPAYLPGEHPFKEEFARRHGIPLIATDGGPETMYPEFQKVLQAAPKPAPLPAPASSGRGAGPAPAAAPQGGR